MSKHKVSSPEVGASADQLSQQLFHLTAAVTHLLKFTVSVSALNADLTKAQQHINALKELDSAK